MLSELAQLGARLIIQRAVEEEFDAGWVGLVMSAGRSVSGGCTTMDAGCAMGFAPGGCRRARASSRSRSRRFARRLSRSSPSCFRSGTQALLRTEPAEGDGDRRVRARPVDARHRVAVRGGGAGKAVEVDRLADLRGAARALRAVQAPRPLRAEAGRRCSSTRSSCRSVPSGPKEGVHVSPGDSPKTATEAGLGACPGGASPRRTGSSSGPRSDRPRTRRATLDRRRRRAGADHGGRGVLAARSTASTAPFTASATCWRSCPRQSKTASASTTGQRSPTRPAVKARQAAPPGADLRARRCGYESAARCLADDLDALVVHLRYPLTTPPNGGGQRTCSNARSARSNAAPK